jgi:hypothetical protein
VELDSQFQVGQKSISRIRCLGDIVLPSIDCWIVRKAIYDNHESLPIA